MTVNEYNNCVNQYADGVFRFILKNIKDEDKAKDIVQDAFEKLWIKLSDIDAATVKSYLFTIAYNGMVDAIRREKFVGDIESIKDNNFITFNNYNDVKEILHEALSKLNDKIGRAHV
jgi:RNA polymerase sigma-70 factor (ECF subfamily)